MKLSKLIGAVMLAAPALSYANLPTQIVIDPVPGIDGEKLTSVLSAKSLGIDVQRVMFDGNFVVARVMDGLDLDEVRSVITKLPVVEAVYDDVAVQANYTPNDSRYRSQWSLFESRGGIKADKAMDISHGAGTVVSVVDTGYIYHPDLDENRVPGYDFITLESNARDGDSRDADALDEGDYCGGRRSSWHGAHVAGISSAVTDNQSGIAGVAPKSRFQPIRALGACGGMLTDIADSVAWAAGVPVAATSVNLNPGDVINLSLGGGGGCHPYMQAAVDAAVERGSVVVAAAGNDNANAKLTVPANCNGVITVAATGRDGGKARYSNYGDVVDVAAPGGGNGGYILSTIDKGRTVAQGATYANYQGTSMAAPHVAGVVALMKAVNPRMTPAQVEQVLESTARSFPKKCNGCGSGIVNAESAVQAAKAMYNGPFELMPKGVAVPKVPTLKVPSLQTGSQASAKSESSASAGGLSASSSSSVSLSVR